jgi:hypothetical protein
MNRFDKLLPTQVGIVNQLILQLLRREYEFEFIYSETNKNKRYTKYNKKVNLRIVLVYN